MAGQTPYATRGAQLEAADVRVTAAEEKATEALQTAQDAAPAAQQNAEASAAPAAQRNAEASAAAAVELASLREVVERASEETGAQFQALVGQLTALLQQGQQPQRPDSPAAPSTGPAQTRRHTLVPPGIPAADSDGRFRYTRAHGRRRCPGPDSAAAYAAADAAASAADASRRRRARRP